LATASQIAGTLTLATSAYIRQRFGTTVENHLGGHFKLIRWSAAGANIVRQRSSTVH
jgi:hypothetical protein